ncbi:MAG: SH3 domain-containing protein [Chloroflexota bacterium]
MVRYIRVLIPVLLVTFSVALAQSQLVALLTADASGVELQRVGTDTWVPINVESVIGVGDTIRTGSDGGSTIRFFPENAFVTLQPETELRIETLESSDDGYTVEYFVLRGGTSQVLTSPDEKPASFTVTTGAVQTLTRGGQFDLSVAANGDTAVLSQAGQVFTVSNQGLTEIPAESGVQVGLDGNLGDVLPVQNMAELTAAVEGVPASFLFEGDILLNVRTGPSTSTEAIGSIDPMQIERVLGTSEDGNWYRIPFNNRIGWVSGQSLSVITDETHLLAYPANHIERETDAVEELVITNEPSFGAPAGEATAVQPGEALITQYSDVELELVALLNEWRINQGMWPVKLNDTLTRMAADQANFVLSQPSWPNDPHVDAQGRNPRQRAVDFQYDWPFYNSQERVAVGEIVATYATPQQAIVFWQGSDIHNRTATNRGYREVGVSVKPHPFGNMYMVVFGSRPDVLPALVDPLDGQIHLQLEEYQYSDGGNWITTIEEFQIVPTVLTPLDDAAWRPWSALAQEFPTSGEFAIAYRGGGKTTINQVNLAEDVVILPGKLPSQLPEINAEGEQVGAAPTPIPETVIELPPAVEFVPVFNTESFNAAVIPSTADSSDPSSVEDIIPLPFAVNTPNAPQ